MKRTALIFVALVFSSVWCAFADYTVWDTGRWPESWPKELEPLRKQSRTLGGPIPPDMLHHAIPFAKRDEFESAWPHLLKVKSKGAPIVLRRGPSFWLGDKVTSGVCIHTPPVGQDPIADGKVAKGNWEKTISIELIVDGEIIDLNRIPLPADTPIIDERFTKNGPEKRAQQSTSAEERLAHLEDQLKTLQQEVVTLREQRLNDQLLLQLSGTWHEINPKADTQESVKEVKPNVWRLTTIGNCDRHEIGEEVKVVVLGELSVDASQTPARITFKRFGPDGEANLGVGIVRFRDGMCEIAMSRKLIPASGGPLPEFPTEFQTTQDADLVLLGRAEGVPLNQ